MLLAEIHGKSVAEARDAEDYLTSAVFGHLRYVPPTVFWSELFAAIETVDGWSLAHLRRGEYAHLTVDFWPALAADEPDLVLTFHHADGRSAVVIIEVKLWSGKSGVGDRDQLVKYLRSAGESAVLVYLTPRDPFAEIVDSLRSPIARSGDEQRLFGLRWQTLHDIARRTAPHAPPPFDRLLSDIAAFLDALGLAGFDKWHEVFGVGDLIPTPATWVTLFREIAGLEDIVPTPATWATPFRVLPDLDITPTLARWTHAP